MRLGLGSIALSLLLVTGVASAQRGRGNPSPPPAPPSPPSNTPTDQMFRVISDGCRFELVEAKLRAGADPNAKSSDTSLKVKVGENGLIGALRLKCNEDTIKAMATGRVPSGINYVNVKKADLEATGLDGVTPLVLAVQIGDVSLVKALMKAGADADRKMKSTDPKLDGKTAFDFLAGQKHEKRLRRILKKDWD